jgi:hypothetical protein
MSLNSLATYECEPHKPRIVATQLCDLHIIARYQWRRASAMSGEQSNNPLHGVTLEAVLTRLVDRYGWDELARKISINCFRKDPSVKSSLTFLRRTPWARGQVEQLYISTFSA